MAIVPGLGMGFWSSKPTVIGSTIDGDIVVGQLNGYWILVAPPSKRFSPGAGGSSGKRWGLYGTDVVGLDNIAYQGTSTPPNAIDTHTGQANTTILCSSTYRNVNDGQGSIGSPAALWCREGLDKAYDLPNKEELNLIYTNKSSLASIEGSISFVEGTSTTYTLANISSHNYPYVWSSSEYITTTAWNQFFFSGNQSGNNKNNTNLWVVPVRRVPA